MSILTDPPFSVFCTAKGFDPDNLTPEQARRFGREYAARYCQPSKPAAKIVRSELVNLAGVPRPFIPLPGLSAPLPRRWS